MALQIILQSIRSKIGLKPQIDLILSENGSLLLTISFPKKWGGVGEFGSTRSGQYTQLLIQDWNNTWREQNPINHPTLTFKQSFLNLQFISIALKIYLTIFPWENDLPILLRWMTWRIWTVHVKFCYILAKPCRRQMLPEFNTQLNERRSSSVKENGDTVCI